MQNLIAKVLKKRTGFYEFDHTAYEGQKLKMKEQSYWNSPQPTEMSVASQQSQPGPTNSETWQRRKSSTCILFAWDLPCRDQESPDSGSNPRASQANHRPRRAPGTRPSTEAISPASGTNPSRKPIISGTSPFSEATSTGSISSSEAFPLLLEESAPKKESSVQRNSLSPPLRELDRSPSPVLDSGANSWLSKNTQSQVLDSGKNPRISKNKPPVLDSGANPWLSQNTPSPVLDSGTNPSSKVVTPGISVSSETFPLFIEDFASIPRSPQDPGSISSQATPASVQDLDSSPPSTSSSFRKVKNAFGPFIRPTTKYEFLNPRPELDDEDGIKLISYRRCPEVIEARPTRQRAPPPPQQQQQQQQSQPGPSNLSTRPRHGPSRSPLSVPPVPQRAANFLSTPFIQACRLTSESLQGTRFRNASCQATPRDNARVPVNPQRRSGFLIGRKIR